MRKIAIFTVIAAIGASVHISAQPPAGGPGSDGKHGGPMRNLTEEQKACVEAAACPQHEMKKPEMKKSEMTEEEKAKMEEARECREKAFKACGIEMPARPEGGRGPRK
ncbi:MAG: hypothetical protein LBL52_03815 [Rickettsiales bacterium]|jgi:hypothetical protein|nr:hypothetical protein [Rickettsiales bacterium]